MFIKKLRRAAVGAAAVLALLSGCGGGGGAEPTVESAATTLSVAQYVASADLSASAPLIGIGTGPQTQNYNDSRIAASAMLQLALAGGGHNAAAVPPLLYAQLDLWRAAARGDTLAQLNQLFPLPADLQVQQARTNPVMRQLWAQKGQTFTPAFLAASRLPALGELGVRWQAAEAGFNDLTYLGLPALQQPLSSWAALPSTASVTNLRLWALDAVNQQLGLPAPQAFRGVFQTSFGDAMAAPMLRVTGGVVHVAGSDHEAEVLALGTRRLIALRPSAGTLSEFVNQNRWITALDEVTARLNVGDVSPGSLVLPAGSQNLAMAGSTWLNRLGLALPFDPINANFRGLDAKGGTYVVSSLTTGLLELGSAGLGFSASAATSFVFNPANVNGAGAGAVTISPGGSSGTPVFPDPCPHVDVDLQPFFLVLIDEFNAVQWAAAIGRPDNAVACTTTPLPPPAQGSFTLLAEPVVVPIVGPN